MFAQWEAALEALRDAAAVTDPDVLDGRRAARLVALAAEGERICAAAKAIGARRVEQCNGWKRSGHRTPADWLAATTGTTVGQAVGTLETARRLDELPETRDAFLAGALSETQTREVAAAAAEDPHAERDLLAAAQSQSVKELRDRSRSVIAAARADDVAHDDKIRKSRFVRAWTDRDGAGCGEWRLPPDAQARVLAHLAAEADSVVREAKAAGAPAESREAYLADALVRLADGNGGEAKSQVAIHLRVDHSAFVRGHTEAGEICEIEGVGPVPVATARNLSTDAVIHALVTTGTDITRHVTLGRTISAALRRTLEARDQVCIVPGCSLRDNLEIHHRDPVNNQGPTSAENCCRPCKWHHYLCTHHGWEVGGEPGNWTFDPPSGRSPPGELRMAV